MEASSDIGSTASRPADRRSGETPPEHGQSKWTLAVDLAANLYDDTAHATGGGTFHKWHRLEALKERTRNSPVSVVVSLPHVDVTSKTVGDLQRNLAVLNDISPVRADGRLAPNQPLIDTFVISHGDMRLIEMHRSLGLAADVESLLNTARKEAPSDKLGLSIFAHGLGLDMAMQGDAGAATQQEMHDAIKRGLGNRDKLDVLDFDGCQMASTDTAHAMQDVARFMVASSDDEMSYVQKNFDAQNTGAAAAGLIAHPDKTPAQFAADFVAQADAGLNGRPTKVPFVSNHLRAGTDTLAAFDLTHYDQFENNLNELARALNGHLDNKSDRDAIGRAIDLTASYPSHVSPAVNNLRDTKQFAQRIIDQINTGKLTDDGAIRRAAESMLSAQDALTIKQHNNADIYRDVGGFTTFLPVTSPASRHEMARLQSGVQAVMIDTPEFQKQFQFKRMLDTNAAMVIGTTGFGMNEAQLAQLKSLDKARLQVAAARDQAQYTRALGLMRSEAIKFMHSDAGHNLVDKIATNARPRNGDPRRSEWSQFVDDLVTRSAADR